MTEEDVTEDISVKEEDVTEDISVKEEVFTEDISVKEEDVTEDISVKEEDVTEDIFVKEEVCDEEEAKETVEYDEPTPIKKKPRRSVSVCPDCGKVFNQKYTMLEHYKY